MTLLNVQQCDTPLTGESQCLQLFSDTTDYRFSQRLWIQFLDDVTVQMQTVSSISQRDHFEDGENKDLLNIGSISRAPKHDQHEM